jgi:hypothetical protein
VTGALLVAAALTPAGWGPVRTVRVVVDADKGRVTQIRGGQRPAVEYVEGCS